MRKICEWSKCKEIAYGQGLIKKDINKQYKWFCGDHLKIHNKTNDNSCDWKRCKQPGEFKAPSKTAGEYKWFCSEHIKIYNHEWDFFSEMSQDKIEEFIHSDITWHKPTSKLGSKDNFFNKKDINKIFNYMKHDKKISGSKINLILLNKIGKAKIFPSDLNKNIKPILIEQFN